MKKVDISIIIVNYNVKDLLLACLKSIYCFAPPSFEIIVVDNDSSDGSIEEVKKNFPDVFVISNENNLGFPFANNQAFKVAMGRYIFMLNPDTEFEDNSIEKLFWYMELHQDISLIAPKLLNTDKTYQNSVWRFPSIFNVLCEMNYLKIFLGKKYYDDKNLSEPFFSESFSGAAIFFRKEVFTKIGFLDDSMFWIEDIDFCYRAYRAGLKLLYYPDAFLLHHIGQSAKKNYKISISNQVFNKIKFFKKHHGIKKTVIIQAISLVHVLSKIFVFTTLSPFKLVYRKKLIAYIYTLPRIFNPPIAVK